MRLLFDVLHPAHVHFFTHLARTVLAKGGDVLFTAREKDVTVQLLEELGLPHEVLTGIGGGKLGLALELGERVVRLAASARRFRADLLLGIMGPAIAPAGRLLGIPSWVFYDTETAWATNFWVYPLSHRLFLPESYFGWAPSKAVRYPGFHELSALHPNRFKSDPSVRAEAGIGQDEPFAFLRLVSWEASHDVGDKGFSDPLGFARWLSSHIRVVVSGERSLPDELRPMALRLPPHRVHHLLKEADLYVGEGATMAREAAVLGTPSIFVHTARLGGLLELENRFQLAYTRAAQSEVQALCAQLLADPDRTRRVWAERRQVMLNASIDVGDFMVKEVQRVLGWPRQP